MLKYIQMYPETLEAVSRYTPEQRCNLYEAMMRYAFYEDLPDWPDEAPEWYVWESLRQRVEAAAMLSETRAAAGRIGGLKSPGEANASKAKQAEATGSKTKQTEATGSKAKPEAEAEAEAETESESKRASEERFDRFWAAYPRKTAKKSARAAWDKLRPSDEMLQTMLAAIATAKNSPQWRRDNGQYIPHPATWLNGQRWLDEMPKAPEQYDQRSYAGEEEELPDWMLHRMQEMGVS